MLEGIPDEDAVPVCPEAEVLEELLDEDELELDDELEELDDEDELEDEELLLEESCDVLVVTEV